MKKIMVAVAALLCGAAMLFAQTSEVKNATSGLIEDGAIDSLDFGTEDADGIVFVQYNPNSVRAGWGKYLADSFWFSIYDNYYLNGSSSVTNSVQKTYGTEDNINVDYIDKHNWQNLSGNTLNLQNTLGIGFDIVDTFGMQILWTANWSDYQSADGTTTVSDTNESTPQGSKSSEKYDKIKHYDRNNTFTFKFNDLGITDAGDNEFFFTLNNIKLEYNVAKNAYEYKYEKTVNGFTTGDYKSSKNYVGTGLNPSITFETGFVIAESDIAKTKLAFENTFAMNFNLVKDSNKNTNVTETSTNKYVYEYSNTTTPGKKLYLKDTLTPKFDFEFDVSDRLELKAQVKAAVSITEDKQAANTRKEVSTNTTYNKVTGTKSIDKTTTTRGDPQNTETLTTSVSPNLALGFVYQAVPEKININFGVNVAPRAYNWTVTTTTNSNINRVETTENTDQYGNVSGSKKVTIENYGGTESKQVSFSKNGGAGTEFNIGTTFFFTENVKFDTWYRAGFGNIFGGGAFGVDLCVLF